MSKQDEDDMADLLLKLLSELLGSNISFHKQQYDLKKHGSPIAGKVDKYIEIEDQMYLFLEVETSKKNPNTNVSKLWPFLEANPDKRVFLIQTFPKNSKSYTSNRGMLSRWLGKKLKVHYLISSNIFQV